MTSDDSNAEPDEAELREQLIDALEDTDYPVTGPMELLPALPNGPSTRIESGDFSITAMEITTEIPQGTFDFPYETPEALSNDLVDEMKSRDIF